MSQLPKSVWTELSADFAGPMPDGSYLLIVVDEYSRFPVVEVISGVAIGCAGCAVHKGPRHSGAPNRLDRNFYTPLKIQTMKLLKILK